MSIHRIVGGLTLGLAVLCGAPAQALLSVSTHPTMRVSCSSGVCTATAASANLNVADLQNMLATSDVILKPGSAAGDILVNAIMHWTSTHTLTLDSWRGITVNHPVLVEGLGGLVVTTNDGGTSGQFLFTGNGYVRFWDIASSFVINGGAYTLENSVAGLASAITANPSGNFALSRSFSARPDGTYRASPIPTIFDGKFEGLGNSISYLTIINADWHGQGQYVGLFSQLGAPSVVRNLNILNARLKANGSSYIGMLAGYAYGTISDIYVQGQTYEPGGSFMGGIVGHNAGQITRVQAHVGMPAGAAGLAGTNDAGATITQSFAAGNVSGTNSEDSGGLVAFNAGTITDCYTVGSVDGQVLQLGGLAADNPGSINSSYVAGLTNGDDVQEYPGAVIGWQRGSLSNVYWDTTTTDIAQGCGKGDCSAAAGLTDTALKSGVPAGFDPAIWGYNPAINSGLPYLLNNPPR